MKIKQLFALSVALLMAFPAFADNYPIVSPTVEYTDSTGVLIIKHTSESFTEQAPLTIRFKANPENTAGYTMNYQWSINNTKDPSFNIVNYTEEFEQTFTRAGEFNVKLLYTYTDTDGKQKSEQTDSIKFTIKESKLDFPNAFSPNGDRLNEKYKAKVCQSIVEFRATIYNRWGQKLYSWTDPYDGWDGTFNGKPVKQGVYYVNVVAKGADGHEYHIRRDVNLLRGYTEVTSTTTP